VQTSPGNGTQTKDDGGRDVGSRKKYRYRTYPPRAGEERDVDVGSSEKVSAQVLYPLGLSLEEAVIETAKPIWRS